MKIIQKNLKIYQTGLESKFNHNINLSIDNMYSYNNVRNTNFCEILKVTSLKKLLTIKIINFHT